MARGRLSAFPVALTLTLALAACAAPAPEDAPVAEPERAAARPLDLAAYNGRLDAARRADPTLRGAPARAVLALAAPEEAREVDIALRFDAAEAPMRLDAAIERRGLLDDSISGERVEITLAREGDGVWRAIAGRVATICARGAREDLCL